MKKIIFIFLIINTMVSYATSSISLSYLNIDSQERNFSDKSNGTGMQIKYEVDRSLSNSFSMTPSISYQKSNFEEQGISNGVGRSVLSISNNINYNIHLNNFSVLPCIGVSFGFGSDTINTVDRGSYNDGFINYSAFLGTKLVFKKIFLNLQYEIAKSDYKKGLNSESIYVDGNNARTSSIEKILYIGLGYIF